jgi:2-polyprenyl-3-methyl-5-hydroxy-6-metoxy-1,4-benzoquinol methylase
MYLTPFPSIQELRDIYNDEYYLNQKFYDVQNGNLYGYTDYVAERFNKQLQYRDIVKEIKKLIPGGKGKEPRLLEIGCGLGFFLDVACDYDFAVTGIEFNEYAARSMRKKYAFEVRCGELQKGMFPDNSFDVVAMFDVIEHLRNAFEILETIHTILSPGGILVLTTMDAKSLVSRLLGKRLEDYRRFREHLLFFSRRTITNVLTQHGFEVLQIKSNPHTFQVGMLLERLTIYNRFIFGTVKRLFNLMQLNSVNVSINFGTKMIVHARKP